MTAVRIITDEEYFKTYDPSGYDNPPVAVDVVMITPDLKVKLITRLNPPAHMRTALPGAFVQPGEPLEDAVKRAVERYIPEAPEHVAPFQMRVFDEFQRDPRERVLSVAHLCPVSDTYSSWTPLADAVAMDLPFDHNLILKYALGFLKRRKWDPEVVSGFLPDPFKVSQYRDLMRAITGKTVDSSNLRKKALAMGIIEPTTDISQGRTTYYRFKREE
jgi:8-oxo-dGTP diphosphatase